MHNLIWLASFFFACFSSFIGNSACPKITSFAQIEPSLVNADANTLVIFDVDDVLITTDDIFMRPECQSFFLNLIYQKFSQLTTEEEKKHFEDLLSVTFLDAKRSLVEQNSPTLIKSLQNQEIKTIALTSCMSGKFGLVENVETWRFDQLFALGIDFSSTFKLPKYELNEIKKADKTAPLFDRGILYCYGYNKGKVLKNFLDTIEWRPSKVIFIDDLPMNIDNVSKVLEEENIPYEAFHYLGASLTSEKIDKKLIAFQFNYLIDHGVWLSDMAARLIMGND